MPRPRDNTYPLAKTLWDHESLKLTPAEFQSHFDAIYRVAEGPATLWRLGGAANDYLRVRPDSITVPNELIQELQVSKIVDGRIIGLKLLTRCSADVPAICDAICRALDSHHEGELYGGLYELGNLLERPDSSSQLLVNELLSALGRLRSSSDPYVRECSERRRSSLVEIGPH